MTEACLDLIRPIARYTIYLEHRTNRKREQEECIGGQVMGWGSIPWLKMDTPNRLSSPKPTRQMTKTKQL